MTDRQLLIQSSPHLRGQRSIHSVMHIVVMALLPPAFAAVAFFGFSALLIMVLSVVGCLVVEAVCLKLAKRPLAEHLTDGSAFITGLLLAMNLPSNLPWWMVLVGAVVAMVLGKHVYGGLGNNPFNPALVARVFLLVSFPTAMTSWPIPTFSQLDGVTAATPLGVLKTEGVEAAYHGVTYLQLFFGNVGGCIGETSVVAILLGAAVLFWKRIITWEIPIVFIATVFVITGLAYLFDPASYADPLFHILSGGLMLGAFFMATDMVTTPISRKGMIIFGLGCGIITSVIRLWAGYPEGVSFSILMMNAFTPAIDRHFKPQVFGETGGVR